MIASRLLFDISPEERDGQKKKPKKQTQREAATHRFVASAEASPPSAFLARVDGHYSCDRCGLTSLDIVDTRIVDGKTKWLVTCGWSCLHSWLVDSVPGVLDDADREQARKPSFVVKGGRFDGKTFDEIAAEGHEWYMRDLATKSKRSVLSSAAAEWLSKNALTSV